MKKQKRREETEKDTQIPNTRPLFRSRGKGTQKISGVGNPGKMLPNYENV